MEFVCHFVVPHYINVHIYTPNGSFAFAVKSKLQYTSKYAQLL
jgi:hypothetical protein